MNKAVKDDFQIDVSTQEEWEDLISKDGLKVIDIYQEWSGPCQSVKNLFKKINEELNDNKLFFATANADTVDTLEKYRGRSEPYFLLYGGQSLVAVVKGANCPTIQATIYEMLKQEHEALAGEIARVEIEDPYLKAIEEEKAAEAKRLARQKEIDQECCPLILHSTLSEENVENVIELLLNAGYEILQEEVKQLDDDTVIEILESESGDPDYGFRLNELTKEPLRCLLVAKGPEGVVNELIDFVGPEKEYSSPDGEPMPSIRDLFGGGKPKECLTAPTTTNAAQTIMKLVFPDFTPPRVITYLPEVEETRPSVFAAGLLDDENQEAGDNEESSGVPEYEGPPRLIVVVKPPAYDAYRDDVMADLEAANFTILSTKDYTFSEDEAREYYSKMSSSNLFENLIAMVTSGPSFIIMACKSEAYKAMKDMLGLESYAQALKSTPDSLRVKYSAPPEGEKDDDLTWIDASLSEAEAKKSIDYFFPVEDTFAMFKPETQPVWEEMLEEIKNLGFKVVMKKEVELLPEDIRVIYENNIDKPYFEDLSRHIASGPAMVMVLRAQDAVRRWHTLIGPTDPDVAVDSHPNDVKQEEISLRATYGRSILANAVHGSTSAEHAAKCISRVFREPSNELEGDSYADKEQEELKEVAGEKEGDDGEEGGGEEQAANDDRAEEVEGEVVAAAAAEEAPGAEAAESAPQTGDSDPVADVDGAASNSNRHNRPSARRRDKSTKPSRPSLVVKRIPASVSSTANTTTSAIANRSRHSTANSRVPKKTVKSTSGSK